MAVIQVYRNQPVLACFIKVPCNGVFFWSVDKAQSCRAIVTHMGHDVGGRSQAPIRAIYSLSTKGHHSRSDSCVPWFCYDSKVCWTGRKDSGSVSGLHPMM